MILKSMPSDFNCLNNTIKLGTQYMTRQQFPSIYYNDSASQTTPRSWEVSCLSPSPSLSLSACSLTYHDKINMLPHPLRVLQIRRGNKYSKVKYFYIFLTIRFASVSAPQCTTGLSSPGVGIGIGVGARSLLSENFICANVQRFVCQLTTLKSSC